MPEQQTSLYDLVKRIRFAKPGGTVYMGIYRANARFVVPDGDANIYGFMGNLGRDFTIVHTRYDDVNGIRVPRELVYFCLGLSESREQAAEYLYHTTAHVHSICTLSANAGSSVIREATFTEFPFGKWRRFTREIPYSDIPRFPVGGRFLNKADTLKLGARVWDHPHRDSLLLAITQYEEALRTWRKAQRLSWASTFGWLWSRSLLPS